MVREVHEIQHMSLFLMCPHKITVYQKIHLENKDKSTRATSHRNMLLTPELQTQDLFHLLLVPSSVSVPPFFVHVVIFWLMNNKSVKRFYLSLYMQA